MVTNLEKVPQETMNEDLFSDEPEPTSPDLFTDDPKPEEKSVLGAGKNLFKDVTGTIKGLGTLATGLATHPIDTTVSVAKGLPAALIDEGKRLGIGELITGNPGKAIDKFGNALYDKPLTTVLDVLPAVGAAAKGVGAAKTALLGGKAAQVVELASEAGNLIDDAARASTGVADDLLRSRAGAPAPIQLPDEAAQILKEKPPVPPATPVEQPIPMGNTFRDTVANLESQIPQQVKEPLRQAQAFAEQKFGRAAAKPGFREIAGDAMIRRAQGMRFRELGGTPGQARILTQKLGEDGLRELMDVAKETGITRSPVGKIRREATEALKESSGRAIGGIREIAAKRGAVHNPQEFVKAIKAKLDAEYLGKGGASSEKGAYLKALEDIKAAAKDPNTLAKKITEMNKRVVKNKMTQPTSAVTDVANEASRLNNQVIKQYLSPKEVEFYDKALRDFGASRIFEKLQSFEIGREMGGRAGVGGLWRNIKQEAMDLGGNKVMENFYDKFGPRLKSDPNVTKNLANLSEGAVDDLLSSLDDAIDELVVK